MLHNKKYSFSFTGASALITETLVVAEEYEKLNDWSDVKKSLLNNNLLNKVKEVTFKREYSEIKKRLSLLNSAQLHVMIHGSLDDAKAMILLSLSKAYAFLKDFIVEVLRNKYLLFDKILTESDYIKFINTKSISHKEITEITEITAKKVKQVTFKLLEQVSLITQIKNGHIIKPVLSNRVMDVIIADDPSFLSVLLFSNHEIKELLQKIKHA